MPSKNGKLGTHTAKKAVLGKKAGRHKKVGMAKKPPAKTRGSRKRPKQKTGRKKRTKKAPSEKSAAKKATKIVAPFDFAAAFANHESKKGRKSEIVHSETSVTKDGQDVLEQSIAAAERARAARADALISKKGAREIGAHISPTSPLRNASLLYISQAYAFTRRGLHWIQRAMKEHERAQKRRNSDARGPAKKKARVS